MGCPDSDGVLDWKRGGGGGGLQVRDKNGRTGPKTARVRALQSSGLIVALVIASAPLSLETAAEQDAACETAEFTSSDTPTPIPDSGTAELELTVPTGNPVQDIDVHIDITHPFDSDLRLKLVSPSGKRVLLGEALGTWGDDFTGTTFDDESETSIVSSLPPFTGSYRAVEELAAFARAPSGGTWKLQATDLRARYSGTIEAWGLTLVTCSDPTVPRKQAGAPDPPPLPVRVPARSEDIEGRLITVTSSDGGGTNGDVSTVDALESNPGPDGVSLREAIEATNNDPGTYTVRFDASLVGAVIELVNLLPVLSGGGLFMDGDIDGDGAPDVTLVDQSDFGGWGFNIASSGNRLHALALRDFTYGVVVTAMQDDRAETPLLSQTTFARNVVSGLLLEDIAAPIAVHPTLWHEECQPGTPCRTASTWLDTRIVGNTIDSDRNGAIWLGWINDDGDVMRRVTVAGNVIRIGGEPVGIGIAQGRAIDLTIGVGGSGDNLIADALVAYNDIEARGTSEAVNVQAGQGGRSGNVIEDVKVVGNRARFSSANSTSGASWGVLISVSDGCWPPDQPVDCDNTVRRAEVSGNVFMGPLIGVQVGEPCCEGPIESGSLTDVRVAANVIESVVSSPPEFSEPWGVVVGGRHGAATSDVIIDSNTIVQNEAPPTASKAAYLIGGGIKVLGGLDKWDASIKKVVVTNNRVDTKLVGIAVVGGAAADIGSYSAQGSPADRNRVSHVKLRGNVILRAPRLATRWHPKLKGISVIGGLVVPGPKPYEWSATRNVVTCVTVKSNRVVGKRDDIAVLANVGAGASKNVARLGGC